MHDELGYPIGYSTEGFYSEPERFFPLPPSLYNTEPGLYMVSTWGRVMNTKTNSIVPKELIPEKNIYRSVQLRDINGNAFNVQIHRLVAETFVIGKMAGTQYEVNVDHEDCIKWHNEPSNLEWVTSQENNRRAIANNLIDRRVGEDSKFASLTNEQYEEICRLTQAGYLPNQINDKMNLGIDITNIAQKIRNGKTVTAISSKYDFSNIPRNDYRKFDEATVRYICKQLQDHPGIDYDDILVQLGYDTKNMDPKQRKKLKNTISTIKRRVSYIDIGKDYNF